METSEQEFAPEELARPAAVLAQRFVQRWDLYPKQLEDGRYVCIHEPLNVELLYAHLAGEITLGIYVLNQESKTRLAVLDSDAEDGWQQLLDCASKLGKDGVPAYLEQSRRGGHLWMFFKEPIAGSLARSFAQSVVERQGLQGIEIFPKQDESGEGPGSLIRMPFGVHRLTGRRYGFFDSNGAPLGRTLREQISALQSPRFVSTDVIKDYGKKSPASVPQAAAGPPREHTSTVSDRIKSQTTVLKFIGQYVDLKPTEGGAIGLCPFHDDTHPSLGINDKENYWHCFAGCGGGSIIDFWSLWRKKQGEDPSFGATIGDLADMLF